MRCKVLIILQRKSSRKIRCKIIVQFYNITSCADITWWTRAGIPDTLLAVWASRDVRHTWTSRILPLGGPNGSHASTGPDIVLWTSQEQDLGSGKVFVAGRLPRQVCVVCSWIMALSLVLDCTLGSINNNYNDYKCINKPCYSPERLLGGESQWHSMQVSCLGFATRRTLRWSQVCEFWPPLVGPYNYLIGLSVVIRD